MSDSREAFEGHCARIGFVLKPDGGGDYLPGNGQELWSIWCASWQAARDKQAASVTEWIKCSDRMPAERCLMFTDNDGLGVMYRIIPAGLVNSASDGTHWMPLPKPPKQKQDHE